MLCDVVSWVENGLVFKHRNKKASFFELQVMFVGECTEVGQSSEETKSYSSQRACARDHINSPYAYLFMYPLYQSISHFIFPPHENFSGSVRCGNNTCGALGPLTPLIQLGLGISPNIVIPE